MVVTECMATYWRTRSSLWLHVVGSTFLHLQKSNSSMHTIIQVGRRGLGQAINISKSQMTNLMKGCYQNLSHKMLLMLQFYHVAKYHSEWHVVKYFVSGPKAYQSTS